MRPELSLNSRTILPPPPKLSWKERFKNRLPLISHNKAADRLPYPHVNLRHWVPEKNVGVVNFGDDLARSIVELVLARKGMTLSDQTRERSSLLSIGSVLHMAKEGTTVWGTGLHGSVPEIGHQYTNLDVRAVRGPLTRNFLLKRGVPCPEIYGDPALLLATLLNERYSVSSEIPVGLVPNFHDIEIIKKNKFLENHKNIFFINPLRPWNVVVAEIAKCAFVISSSLHGLVVADSLGIKSRMIRFSEHERTLKYEDYFEGTGRVMKYVNSINEALDKGDQNIHPIDTVDLLAAFPYDLWR